MNANVNNYKEAIDRLGIYDIINATIEEKGIGRTQ